MNNILKIATFPEAVRLINFSKLENEQQGRSFLKSGLYIEWSDYYPSKEARFIIIEKDGIISWISDVSRDQYSKLIPIAIMAV